MVDVHATCITFESLPRQPPEQGTTVLTEGWTLVVVDFESVWHVDLESLLMEHGFSAIDCGSCALGYHFINALLVNRCITLSALVTLLVQAPLISRKYLAFISIRP